MKSQTPICKRHCSRRHEEADFTRTTIPPRYLVGYGSHSTVAAGTNSQSPQMRLGISRLALLWDLEVGVWRFS